VTGNFGNRLKVQIDSFRSITKSLIEEGEKYNCPSENAPVTGLKYPKNL
jgi:hypothetical protein